ncbi:hypothetical protein OIV83_003270 [Microbotryomycetes sp. JL201]|nr:hypothetical protein OIV83_003270 [Microbotryomycetes sp. JL201]
MSSGEIWRSFAVQERTDIGWYICGIMFYKLGWEFFNGSITALATDRFNAASTFTKLGAAQGLNQAAQVFGSIAASPLIHAFTTRSVLSVTVVFLAFMTTILLIVDAATGGRIKSVDSDQPSYGTWNPNLIFFVWTVAGVAFGSIELVRRVIPADIVGGNVAKLRRMDAAVYVWYQVAGTAGAFASSAAISRFGNNYSFILSPILFVMAGLIWTRMSATRKAPDATDCEKDDSNLGDRPGRVCLLFRPGYLFLKSVGYGVWVVMSHRRFVWLFPAYSIALYLHRFLESSVAPAFARRVLGQSAWSQIIIGGSNFGELLGAASVFVLNDHIPTPIPWLRFDALMLNLIWVLPHFSRVLAPEVSSAWKLAIFFCPLSIGWSSGDCSLTAYIQSSLNDSADFRRPRDVSALGATMAFLFSSYIILNAVLSTLLGRVIDRDFESNGNIYAALQQVGGVQFSVGCAIILMASLVPVGAFAINPQVLNHQLLPGQEYDESAVGLERGSMSAGLDQGSGRREASCVKSQPPTFGDGQLFRNTS